MSGRTGWARNVQSGTTKVSEKSLEKDKLLSAGGREQWVERGKKVKLNKTHNNGRKQRDKRNEINQQEPFKTIWTS